MVHCNVALPGYTGMQEKARLILGALLQSNELLRVLIHHQMLKDSGGETQDKDRLQVLHGLVTLLVTITVVLLLPRKMFVQAGSTRVDMVESDNW